VQNRPGDAGAEGQLTVPSRALAVEGAGAAFQRDDAARRERGGFLFEGRACA
jgi:hypothetical protein